MASAPIAAALSDVPASKYPYRKNDKVIRMTFRFCIRNGWAVATTMAGSSG